MGLGGAIGAAATLSEGADDGSVRRPGGPPMSEMDDFNAQIIAEFRANDGVVGGPFEGLSVLLLHTTGAKSGTGRVNPVVVRMEGDQLYVFASKAGAPTNPDWFHNLVAHPEVTAELGTDTFTATAVVVEGEERDRIYAAQAAQHANFAEYEAMTDRVIPVVQLVRS
jgi:deazaflavin-dependent oxidoreductase (nitroreductase family)